MSSGERTDAASISAAQPIPLRKQNTGADQSKEHIVNDHRAAFETHYGLDAWTDPRFTELRRAWMRALHQAASETKSTEAQAKVFYDYVKSMTGDSPYGVEISFEKLYRKLMEART
jgi:hypothetical protein